jgi:hypothetical protein
VVDFLLGSDDSFDAGGHIMISIKIS